MIAVRAFNSDIQVAEYANLVEKHGGTVLSVAVSPKSRWHVFFRVEDERILASADAEFSKTG